MSVTPRDQLRLLLNMGVIDDGGVSRQYLEDQVAALLDNLPLVLEAAEETGKAERIVHPEMTANLIGRTPVWWIL